MFQSSLEVTVVANFSPFFLQGSCQVNVIYTKTFIFARFHPYNIMHVLHDDLFNLYHHLVRYASLGTGLAPEAVFSLDHQFQMYDLHEESAYFKLLKFFTNKWVFLFFFPHASSLLFFAWQADSIQKTPAIARSYLLQSCDCRAVQANKLVPVRLWHDAGTHP